MCSVSMVSDYYMNPIPGRIPDQASPYGIPAPGTGFPVFPIQQMQGFPAFDEETKRLLREAIERLDKIDKRLGDIECKDEKKKEFLIKIGFENGQISS